MDLLSIDFQPDIRQPVKHCTPYYSDISLPAQHRTKERLWDGNRPEDTTQFTITLRMTQIAGNCISLHALPHISLSPLRPGVVPLLYGMLLHTQIFSRGHSPGVVPPEAPRHALDIACLCVALLNHVALLDLTMLQVR